MHHMKHGALEVSTRLPSKIKKNQANSIAHLNEVGIDVVMFSSFNGSEYNSGLINWQEKTIVIKLSTYKQEKTYST